MKTLTDTTATYHLLRRAGFGPSLTGRARWVGLPPRQALEQLWADAQPIDALPVADLEGPSRQEIRMMSEQERRKLRQQGRQSLLQLNVAWIERMVHGRGQLREKMTLFWHDHFACRFNSAFLAQGQHELLRRHALGKFGDLLRAIARDPGMLRFLNNQQNRKEAPNENFGRELLELFTLGRGHYREADIQAAARAFTGWGFNLRREFVFRQAWHDDGPKTFLGQTGPWNGDDIIRIILAHKRTAYFLTTKLYRYFIHVEVDQAQVAAWAEDFYAHDYDLGRLLQQLFTSDHFYDQAHRSSHLKSPVEYLVSLLRLTGASLRDPQGHLLVQKVLGQTLFQPPNVAGWPLGREWIDSSSLMARLQIPRAMLGGEALELRAKASFAGNEDAIKLQGQAAKLQAEMDWDRLAQAFAGSELLPQLQSYLLARPLQGPAARKLAAYAAVGSDRQQLQALTLHLLSTPEFQLQ